MKGWILLEKEVYIANVKIILSTPINKAFFCHHEHVLQMPVKDCNWQQDNLVVTGKWDFFINPRTTNWTQGQKDWSCWQYLDKLHAMDCLCYMENIFSLMWWMSHSASSQKKDPSNQRSKYWIESILRLKHIFKCWYFWEKQISLFS